MFLVTVKIMNKKNLNTYLFLILFFPLSLFSNPINKPDQIDFFYKNLNFENKQLEKVKIAVQKKDWASASKEYKIYRQTFLETFKWHFSVLDKPTSHSGEVDPRVYDLMNHYAVDLWYGIVGDEKIHLGENINWEFNPRKPSDPKYNPQFEWAVVNRHEAWSLFGKAYWATGDDKYVKAWVDQLLDWISDCKAPSDKATFSSMIHSKTWSPLTASARVKNAWPDCYIRMIGSKAFNEKAHLAFCISALQHGLFIQRMLNENKTGTNNHTLAQSAALVFLGTFFPEFSQASTWRLESTNRLEIEAKKQVYPNGIQTELSPGYHIMSVKDYLENVTLLKENGYTVSLYLEKIAEQMARFPFLLSEPSGLLPELNDSWELNIKKQNSFFKNYQNDPEVEYIITSGEKGKKPPHDIFFEYAGYYTMRSGWDPQAVYALFDGGPQGTGHWHEDKLHFLISAFGERFIIDTGNYTYDQSEERRYCQLTSAHNTIMVNEKDQKRGEIKGGNNRIIEHKIIENPHYFSDEVSYVSSEYRDGYQKSKWTAFDYYPIEWVGEIDRDPTHTRHFIYLKPNTFLIIDNLNANQKNKYEAFFHFASPNAQWDQDKQTLTYQGQSGILTLQSVSPKKVLGRVVVGQENPMLGWSFHRVAPKKRPIATLVQTLNETSTVFANVIQVSQQKPNEMKATITEEKNKIIWTLDQKNKIISGILNRDDNLYSIPQFSILETDAKSIITLDSKNILILGCNKMKYQDWTFESPLNLNLKINLDNSSPNIQVLGNTITGAWLQKTDKVPFVSSHTIPLPNLKK